MSICWVITGAGHFLRESVAMLSEIDDVEIFMTRAGAEVAARYSLYSALSASGKKLRRESDSSAGELTKFFNGHFEKLVIAPATSNTVAKCAMGIADSLASTFFAQAGKAGIPALVLPTDQQHDITSESISGAQLTIRPRAIDIAHVEALSRFDCVTVARSPQELRDLLMLG